MPPRPKEWHTGSFTKNFRWGRDAPGLKRLYDAIRVGFDEQSIATPRDLFRERLRRNGFLDFIPVNFFLYNRIYDGETFIVVDELVFKSLEFDYDSDFDKLALFSLLLSDVGRWPTATENQQHPAEWARHYVLENIDENLEWKKIDTSANSIEVFLNRNKNFVGRDTRKLSTNLSFIFRKANISGFSKNPPERWWGDAIFLSLDRFFLDTYSELTESIAIRGIHESHALELSGGRTAERESLLARLIRLYVASHGIERFSADKPELTSDNNPAPLVALLSGTPRIEKALPFITWRWLEERLFVHLYEQDQLPLLISKGEARQKIEDAVKLLKDRGISSNITGDELINLTRSDK